MCHDKQCSEEWCLSQILTEWKTSTTKRYSIPVARSAQLTTMTHWRDAASDVWVTIGYICSVLTDVTKP